MVLYVSNATRQKEATVPSKKQLTKSQAEAQIKKNAPEYRLYVQAQIEKKDAKTDKARKAAERKMNSHRSGYTAYRNAYRRFKELGGVLRKPAKAQPAKGSGKSTSAKKRNTGAGKGSRKVTTKKLSAAAMKRRDPKTNPDGLTEKQLAANGESAAVTPNSEVIRQG